MRAYFLTNMYLSPIQCGIQSAHCLHEMFNIYLNNKFNSGIDILKDWSENHKTMIVLNGGTSSELQEFYNYMMQYNEDYPFACFREPGIDNALTCVGVVVDERIVAGIKYARENRDAGLPDFFVSNGKMIYTSDNRYTWEWNMAQTLASKPLA